VDEVVVRLEGDVPGEAQALRNGERLGEAGRGVVRGGDVPHLALADEGVERPSVSSSGVSASSTWA